ncbi:hypothetical protein [Aquabacter spiritensis]|uniref:Uncharacterized protein n=1 Tax=Aquabacter spiritensis TaxID=933073 RepID=A0A4R3M926_9HYPH|nr:hypothetical protein [Aquabacter spiritensis]TCT07875.1 hypothetical protein EDC64_101394 [Aquabacter spiritensis]
MDPQTVILHVRFAPNGSVVEISERPPTLSPQDWFNTLSFKAADAYQTLAGGRGVFRLTRAGVDALRAEAAVGTA